MSEPDEPCLVPIPSKDAPIRTAFESPETSSALQLVDGESRRKPETPSTLPRTQYFVKVRPGELG